MSRPVPVPTELSEPFWDAARRGDLVVPYCPNCELRFFVPEPACPGCMAADWHYVPSAGRGTVYSVTVVHRAPGPGFDTPFALAGTALAAGGTRPPPPGPSPPPPPPRDRPRRRRHPALPRRRRRSGRRGHRHAGTRRLPALD